MTAFVKVDDELYINLETVTCFEVSRPEDTYAVLIHFVNGKSKTLVRERAKEFVDYMKSL